MNDFVGQMDSRKQLIGLERKRLVGIPVVRGTVCLRLQDVLTDSFDNQLTGDLAGPMTAHAVCHDVQAEIVVQIEGIFISFAFHAHVSHAG